MMDGGISAAKMTNVGKVCLGFATICLLVDVIMSQGLSPVEDQFVQDTTNRFSGLSETDLLDAWHTECHRRCRYQLTWHIDLACRFDPYKIEYRRRRSTHTPTNKIPSLEAVTDPRNDTYVSPPAFSKDLPESMARNSAVSFLNAHKRTKRSAGIMEECCLNKACSWEEFGEYCQRHPRRSTERQSVCAYN
ncbi:hypothetical protein BsWGS_28136 [Bradybaena similaris]